jgi:hypothetical protein
MYIMWGLMAFVIIGSIIMTRVDKRKQQNEQT